jgi:6-phosphofructokinase 1
MNNSPKRLGILTSGGDCPGLNAGIRAVVHHAIHTYGWQVYGINCATQGLIEQKANPLRLHGLDLHGIDPLLQMGGTILGSNNKGDTLAQAEAVLAGYQALQLNALVGIGGDGSLRILHELAKQGNWQFIAMPKTIDNDVALTERVIGFDTAVNTVTDALNRLIYTAASHDRVMLVEAMGRDAGHLALHAGIAGGADIILIPEIPFSIGGICAYLTRIREQRGQQFALIVVAEGIKTATDAQGENVTPVCGMSQYLAAEISASSEPPIEVRISILGHIQRGGIPSAQDRLLATVFGKTAVDLIAHGETQKMVAWQCGEVVAVPLSEVLAHSPLPVDPHHYLLKTAQALDIYVGDRPSSNKG